MRLFTLIFLTPFFLSAQPAKDLASDDLYAEMNKTHFATLDIIAKHFDLKNWCKENPDACAYHELDKGIKRFQFDLRKRPSLSMNKLKVYTIQDSVWIFIAKGHSSKRSIKHQYPLSGLDKVASDFQRKHGQPFPHKFFTKALDEPHDIVYGSSCGIVGEAPKTWRRMITAVQQKDTTLLKDWLWSLHTEYEAYGATGFFFLQRLGVQISPKVSRRAESIRRFERPLATCSGCLFGDRNSITVLNDIILQRGFEYFEADEYLKRNPGSNLAKFKKEQKRRRKQSKQ